MLPTKSYSRALILAVHYKSEQAALWLVESLQRLKRLNQSKTIIIDNASGDEHLSRLNRAVAALSNAELLILPSNCGYLGAAKLALREYMNARNTLPEWVIVSNADITIEDERFLERLFELDPTSVGMVAPMILVPSLNLNQNPFMRERPGWLTRFTIRVQILNYFSCVAWDWLWRVKKGLKSTIARKPCADTANIGRSAIYAPHGSFMIFSRRYFESGGYLDDELFLYGEEISVGEICQRLALPVIYDPSLSVLHNEHQSVGTGVTRTTFNHFRRSMRHVYSKYLHPQAVRPNRLVARR